MGIEKILTDALYTPQTAAELLLLNDTTILKAIRNGKLTAYRVGERQYRITRDALLDWLDPTAREIK